MAFGTDNSNIAPLTPDAFRDKLNKLSQLLMLHFATAIRASDGFVFRTISDNDINSLMHFLFPSFETETAKMLLEYIQEDTPNQSQLDEIYRVLASKVDDWILCGNSQLNENLKYTWLAQRCLFGPKGRLPNTLEELKATSDLSEPIPFILNNIRDLFSSQVLNCALKADCIGTISGISPEVAILVIVLSWLSQLTTVKTDSWVIFDNLLRAALSTLANEFSLVIALAQGDINRLKTQGKINLLQQKTDNVSVRINERNLERVAEQINGNSNARTLTREE